MLINLDNDWVVLVIYGATFRAASTSIVKLEAAREMNEINRFYF
jgi:hypothetical protein